MNSNCRAIASPVEYINEKYTSGEWDLTKQSTHVFEEYKHIASVSAGSIPYLDKENVYTHKISPYSLVRYQCLVQDIFNPEFFVGAYVETDNKTNTRHLVNHQYCDEICAKPNVTVDLDSKDCITFERQPLFCVPIPCETPWAITSRTPLHLKKRTLEGSPDDSGLEEEEKRQVYGFGEGVPAIVKLYTPTAPVKLNTMLEVIGLYTPPSVASEDKEDDDLFQQSYPRVPIIHALYYHSLPATHPIQPHPTSQSPLSVLAAIMNSELLAQYILCTIVSSVYERYEAMPLGNMSLNISGLEVDDNRITLLVQFLQSFLPRVAQLDVTISALNSRPVYCFKDAATERISPSPLMLPKSTLLVINETALVDGGLDSIGTRSADAIMRLVSSQQLAVCYDYFSVNIPLDVPVIILSKSPSIFRPAIHIHAGPAFIPSSPPPVLDTPALRQYWADAVSRSVTLHNSALPYIEDDFLKLRTVHEMNETIFHLWLVLTRLIAISEQSSDIMISHWEKMKSFEKARKEHNRHHFPSPCETPPPLATGTSRSPITTIHPTATPFPTYF